jgi:fumarate hydratase, class II
MGIRLETDSLGDVEVPDDMYYGAQTQRSKENFPIGHEKIPIELIYAFAFIKKSAALVNFDLGLLPKEKCDLIGRVCDEIIEGKLDEHFVLVVWQTGSGTQTNMNVNEVISNRAAAISGVPLGLKDPLHPNNHVNCSQSSNDTFPTAMHIASVTLLLKKLIPALDVLRQSLDTKSKLFMPIIKVGRTHLMDATPLSLGQEFSGYVAQLDHAKDAILYSLGNLYEIALGGTAVGTGINSHPEFAVRVAEKLATLTNLPFVTAPNKFAALAANDAMVTASSALKRLSGALLKIANDLRWMGSGPRCGIGELKLPANEPGSSIMPGKINPTQCEAITMLCIQVIGNDTALAVAASQGNFELNVFKPMIFYNFWHSLQLLADGMLSLEKRCIRDLQANEKQINLYLKNSLMLATALNKEIGYDQASKIVKKAYDEDLSLKESALSLGILSEETFDEIVDPKKMVELL